ncbi:hypothetical protein TorRG33x02_284020, partial [Trema orientale]
MGMVIKKPSPIRPIAIPIGLSTTYIVLTPFLGRGYITPWWSAVSFWSLGLSLWVACNMNADQG